MGEARTRLSIWAAINYHYSPDNIEKTAETYKQLSAGGPVTFENFVADSNIISEGHKAQWHQGCDEFPEPIFKVVDTINTSNLGSDDPLPMYFERNFGPRNEAHMYLTQHGIKVVIVSTEDIASGGSPEIQSTLIPTN